jgi:hypothetical protein
LIQALLDDLRFIDGAGNLFGARIVRTSHFDRWGIAYWPHGIDHPSESERGQFGNVALFGGNPFCDEAYSTLLTQPHLVSAFL